MRIFDSTLQTVERAMDIQVQRHHVLISNIANKDTPGYHGQDVDFQAAMRQAAVPVRGPDSRNGQSHRAHMDLGTMGGHMQLPEVGELPLVDFAGARPGLDGNDVQLDKVNAAMAENGIRYTANAKAAMKKLSILRAVVADAG